MKTMYWLLSCACLMAFASSATAFDKELSVKEGDKTYHMQLVGQDTVKKFFFTVYEQAFYLENPKSGPKSEVMKEVYDGSKAKAFVYLMEKTVSKKQLVDGVKDRYKGELSAQKYAQFKDTLNQYADLFGVDTKEGDRTIVYWLPGGVIRVDYNGQLRGTIKNEEFAKIVWETNFSPKDLDPNKLIKDITH